MIAGSAMKPSNDIDADEMTLPNRSHPDESAHDMDPTCHEDSSGQNKKLRQ
jgi:hypothetical protein